jgi:hypothetical protein
VTKAVFFVIVGELVNPKRFDHGVLYVVDNSFAVFFVNVHSGYAQKRVARAVQQGQNSVVQNIFHSG